MGPADVATRLRVLVVEDNDLVRDMFRDMLAGSYMVACSPGAEEALAAIAQRRPDLILLDYLLPGGRSDAVEAAAQAAGIPVLWMSGHPDVAETLRGRRVLMKPFLVETLLKAMAEMLDDK